MDGKQSANTLKAVRNKARRAEAFQAFCLSRQNGLNITLSSKAAGISRMTGGRWESERKAALTGQNRLAASERSILARDQLAGLLSASVERCEDQYKANIATALSRVMGYDAPTRQQIEVRQIPASVTSWLEQIDAIDVEAEHVDSLPPATPSKALGE